jgi:GT2 family glycosyltransferase
MHDTISVIIVTWNGLHLLRRCVQSLQAQTIPFELVVVDNGSSDGTAAWVRAALPSARLIAAPHNLGFAAGNNLGMRAARGDRLVLINNDTLAPPDFVEKLVRPLDRVPNAGASAGVLTFAHRQEIVASAGIVPGMDGVHRDALALRTVSELPRENREIFGASGGAVCLRRSALEDVGLFEERFFAYLEDADLAWRLRLRGWRTILAPEARIAHIYSATSGQGSPFKQRLLGLNRWRVLIRCVPGELLRHNLLQILRYELLTTAYALLHRQPAILHGRLEARRELPRLLAERRHILGCAAHDAPSRLRRWLAPAPSVHVIRAEAAALDRLLSERGR